MGAPRPQERHLNASDSKKPCLDTHQSALGEYFKHGRVVNVRCEKCNDVIEVEALSSSAWVMRCTCGTYNDTLRGL